MISKIPAVNDQWRPGWTGSNWRTRSAVGRPENGLAAKHKMLRAFDSCREGYHALRREFCSAGGRSADRFLLGLRAFRGLMGGGYSWSRLPSG